MNPLCALLFALCCFASWMTTVQAGICLNNTTSLKRCQLNKGEAERISCSGDMPFLLQNVEDVKRWKYEENVARLRALVVCNLPWDSIDPNFISRFPKLQRLSIINSDVSTFTRNFPFHQSLMMLNLTRLRLTTITADLFTMLKSLRVLDLSHNRIRYLNQIVLKSFNNLQHLYLKGDHWDCSKDVKWLLSTKNSSLVRKVLDVDQMVCSERNYSGKPVSAVMKFIKVLESECPSLNADKHCVCKLDYIARSNTQFGYLVPITIVNCTGLGWTHLPHTLPPNTTTLILNNNEIKDVTPLVTNYHYRSVSDIYLDYNKISSLDDLESAPWLSKFRIFSVKSNRLTKLPANAFDRAFQKNFHLGKIYLGNNPWKCDCMFTPSFKELILKYRIIIVDIYEIRCAQRERDENSMKTIHNLSLKKVCHEPKQKMKPIDFLNIILAFLLLLLLGHFLYSYWVYKSTGQLPWIAMQLP